jgi:RimJ/RimL family protein N-acetyltransferase
VEAPPAGRRRAVPALEPLTAGPPASVAFRRLRLDDFAQLRDWLNEPHVAAWWGAGATSDGLGGTGDDAATLPAVDAAYRPGVEGRDPTFHYLIVVDDTPVGLIQWYRLASYPSYAAAIGEPDGAGVDLFLGDPTRIGQGLGPTVIDRFVTDVVFAEPDVRRCVAGPDPANRRSVGAFERAGFRWVRDADVPDEPGGEHVMVRDRV